MTKKQFDSQFTDLYGGIEKVKQEAKQDYPKLHLNYVSYMDSLCKDGVITQRQWQNWTMPWKK